MGCWMDGKRIWHLNLRNAVPHSSCCDPAWVAAVAPEFSTALLRQEVCAHKKH